ncbi:hypothetical protein MHYP_G00137730 [Metynnis hypsauchen]
MPELLLLLFSIIALSLTQYQKKCEKVETGLALRKKRAVCRAVLYAVISNQLLVCGERTISADSLLKRAESARQPVAWKFQSRKHQLQQLLCLVPDVLPDVAEVKTECVVSPADGCPQLASGVWDHKVREVIEYQQSAPSRLTKGGKEYASTYL